jgi:antitoxin ParD1/3/4
MDIFGGRRMNVSIGPRWEKFIEEAVQDGRYSSASDVVREGLRLVQEREAKLSALRDTLQRSFERGGDVSEEELDASLEAAAEELRKEGY